MSGALGSDALGSDSREHRIITTLVRLATSLAAGRDATDLFTGLTDDCADLLGVAAAGLLLADGKGVLHLMAASSQEATSLELFQLQRSQGPCLDCVRSGAAVSADDLARETGRWPQFAPAALAAGFASVHAMPMRLGETVLGALNLFGAQVGPLSDIDRDLAQAFADVASVALVQDQAVTDKDRINVQLEGALSSRVIVEQAKGFLAEKGGLDMEEAFEVLRRYSRNHNERLSAVASGIISRQLVAGEMIAADQVRRASGQR